MIKIKRALISVSDKQGLDDLVKIFGQGYNTKNGGRGMSLHSGALMAKNLGGALRAHSEGIGHGATFSLELPGNFHFPDL